MLSILERVCERLLVEVSGAVVPRRHIRQLIRPGLKVMHSDSRVKCTIVDAVEDGVTLKTPEGASFCLGMDEFEQDYVVD